MRATLGVVMVTAMAIGGQQQPVFRGRTDLVTIDVSIRSQGTPVAGLTGKDFVLLDNGVQQAIEQIEMEAVPVDVSILVDMNEDLADDLNSMSDQIPRIAALLRPDDRLRVTAINTYVTDLVPAQRAAAAPPVSRLTPSGLSSAHDGLAAALLREVAPNRRHLIIALTNGVDAVSALEARAVRDIARYSGATLYIAQVDIAFDPDVGAYLSGRQRRDRDRCAVSWVCSPTKRFWQPFGDYEFETLAEAAELTGGKLYLPGVFTDRTAAAIFKKVFEDYRRSYLLRYSPPGPPAPGWHEVTVTLPGYPSYEVQARRGYYVEAPGGAQGAPPYEGPTGRGGAPPAAPSEGRTGRTDAPARVGLAELAETYGRNDFATFVEGLQRVTNRTALLRELADAGNPWPNNPLKEAVFVLELADFALQSPQPADREPARRLLTSHQTLVRSPFGPGAYERYWLWSAILILEGANQPATTIRMVDDALKRFHDEPRFLLARAFSLDQRRALDTLARGATPIPTMAAHVDEVAAAYDAAIPFAETATEARLRKGWLFVRAGRSEQALALFDEVRQAPADPFLAYLLHLFRARALDALGRLDRAAEAYRAALAAAPTAQSARVGLMAVLQRRGDHDGARALATATETAGPDAIDPWWRYWQGDYRLVTTVLTRLRELGR